MALAHKKLPSVGYGIGLLCIYLGERVFDTGRFGTAAVLLGLALILVALILAIRDGKNKPAGNALPLLYVVGLLALGMCFGRSTLPGLLGHRSLEVSSPKLDGVLAVLWPAVLCASVLPVFLVELAFAGMVRAPVIDARRVRSAALSGIEITLALVFCFAIAYVASERNPRADLSFFRTARASNATKQLASALDKPVEITLFYPPGNEVAEELARYFADLKKASTKLTVLTLDQAVEPAKAKALGVSSNGSISFAQGTVHEQLPVPPKLENARAKLRSLDQDVYKRIASIARGKRTVYLVQGHEERTFTTPRDGDASASLSLLRELLSMQNLDVRDLGLAQGLSNDVPADAALVLWIGPQKPILPEEATALLRYAQRGGRMLIAADPEAADAVAPVLAGLALELDKSPLANDRIFWARTHQKADRVGIVPTGYVTHPALASLAPLGAQMPLLVVGAGALSKTKVAPSPAPTVDFVIKTDASTWADKDGNYEPDKDEQRKIYPVAAAVTLRSPAGTGGTAGTEGRVFVLGDSDAFSDLIIKNRGNAILAMDVIRWLIGEPEAGPINSEEDVPVRHTRKQDVVWFYSSVFLAPALVLLVGWMATRRRRKQEVKP